MSVHVNRIVTFHLELPCLQRFTGPQYEYPSILTLYLIETPFNEIANRADPDQAAIVRAA